MTTTAHTPASRPAHRPTINLVDDLTAGPVHLPAPTGPTESTGPEDPATAVAEWIHRGAQRAAEQLRWIYTLHYRRHHRNGPPSRYGDQFADQIACANLRLDLPTVLARHLPGVHLIEWVDPHPSVIDSTWTLHGWHLAVYWDYHPSWTTGDADTLRVHPVPAHRADEVAA